MRKRAYFDTYCGSGWPELTWLEPYFLAPESTRWSFETGNDGGSLTLEGVNASEGLGARNGSTDIHLLMLGHRAHGVMLQYFHMGGGSGPSLYSCGDLRRVLDAFKTRNGDLVPLGLCVPFERAWCALKEFIEREGALPQSIEWIASRDLPKNVFPDE